MDFSDYGEIERLAKVFPNWDLAGVTGENNGVGGCGHDALVLVSYSAAYINEREGILGAADPACGEGGKGGCEFTFVGIFKLAGELWVALGGFRKPGAFTIWTGGDDVGIRGVGYLANSLLEPLSEAGFARAGRAAKDNFYRSAAVNRGDLLDEFAAGVGGILGNDNNVAINFRVEGGDRPIERG